MNRSPMPRRAPLRRDAGEARAMVPVPRPRICKACLSPFQPPPGLLRPIVCSPKCGEAWARARREKAEAKAQLAERRADKVRREKLKPRSYWEKQAEAQVNRYVRLRDASLGCASCDRPASWSGQWHASHFRSVGAASAIRFHLWNIAKACSICNNWKSGNLSEYEPRLRARIGDAKVDWLKTQNQIRRYDVDYLKRLKIVFSKKANRMAKHMQGA